MAGLAAVGTGVEEGLARGGELVDGVKLPGQVVQDDAASTLRSADSADAEQPKVVVIAGAWQPEERRVGAGFVGR